jgi:uncharacterized membrane protein (UPF0136 family)
MYVARVNKVVLLVFLVSRFFFFKKLTPQTLIILDQYNRILFYKNEYQMYVRIFPQQCGIPKFKEK